MGSPNDVGAEPGTGPVTGSFSQDPSSTISTTTTTTTTSYLSTSASALNGKSGSNTHEANLESGLPQSEQYCLRWMNHGSHMLGVFSQLLHDEALVDVTLAAEGQSVRAHKMVLSACSSFFRNLFISHPERHPIIILKDTKFEELKTLLEFMYKGEVSVEHGQLGTLLKTAENLRVKGLAEIATDQSGHPVSTPPPPTADDSEEENSTIVVERDPSETNSGPDKRGTLPCLQQDNLSYYPPPYVHPHHQPYHVYDHPKVHHGSLQYANYGGYPFEYRDVNRHGRDDFMCSNGRLSNTSKPPLRFACLDLNNKGKEENQSDKNISQVHRRDTEESTERNTPLSNTTNVSAARAELKDPHRSSSPNPRSPAAETRDLAMSTNTSQYPWPAEESDISESDEEPSDVNRNTTDLEGHARQNTIFQQGGVSSVRSKQCQSLPLSLKKEPEWDAGPGASAGAGPSGMDTQPSRSPSVSDSSSEYGHHVDQGQRQDDLGRLGGNAILEQHTSIGQPKAEQSSRCSSVDSVAVPSTSRAFPCPQCGTSFPSASRLARHMLSHTVESTIAPISGPISHDLDIRKGHKRRHMSAMHANAEPSLAAMFSVNRPPSTAGIILHSPSTVRFEGIGNTDHHFRNIRSRHHSSEACIAEDLRSRPTVEKLALNSSLGTFGSASFRTSGAVREDRSSGPSHHSSPGSLAESEGELRRERHPNIAVQEHLAMLGQAGLDGSLGSLPGVAVLASLMGNDPQAAALGSVMFPRISEAQPSMSHSHNHFSNLSLSYSAAAAAAALGIAGHSVSGITTQSGSSATSVAPSSAPNPGTSSGSLRGAGPPALCKFCGKSFVELGALMAHLPFHTGERPFRCDFCGKAFKLRHHMKDHARVHTGERPFPCRLCGKTFSRSTILKAHEKTHLPKSERNFLQPQSPPPLNNATLPPS